MAQIQIPVVESGAAVRRVPQLCHLCWASLGSEGVSNTDDLFNLTDVCVAMVDVVTHSSDGSDDGLVGGVVVCERDGHLCSSEWGANGGTRM